MRDRVGVAVAVVLIAAVVGAVASAAPVRTSTSGWIWGSPQPQGHALRALEFAGARGYAAGDFGTVLRTDDGGTSWSGVRTGASVRLRKLRVIDADSFIAAGACTLLRSDDGGQTVRRRDLPGPRTCNAPVAGLDFPTASLGYVVRANRAVLRTTDGGATFTSRAPLPAGGGPPNDVEFTSASVGVAVTGLPPEGRIFRTTDGGASWAQVFSGHSVNGVFFVSATTGYAVGSRLILRTDDGGATWTPKPTPESTRYLDVNCADELHCVATTEGGIVYTDDGFATHHNSTPAFVTEATGVGGNAAAFATPDRVVAVSRAGRTFTSDDGGKTFDKRFIPSFRADSLAAGPGRVGYAFGSRGRLARTTDGGQTWKGRTQIPTSRPIDGWWIPDLGGVIAIDRQGFLFRSDDGGGSWAELGKASPARPRSLWTSKDRQTVLIAGPFGLRRSTDGGASFSHTRTELLEGLQATGNRGAEVNVFGPQTLLRTHDRGATFTALNRPPGNLAEVDFVTSTVGFALTRDARLWRTDNAGGKWRELVGLGPCRALLGLGSYIVNAVMSFRAKQDGSIAGSLVARDFGGTGKGFGWILHTSDGGASWRPQLVDNQPVRGIVQYPGDAHSNALTHPNPNSKSYYSPNRIFFTTTGGDAGKHSAIHLVAGAPKNGRAVAVGKLDPAVGGAKVVVSLRAPGSKRWRVAGAHTNSKGGFRITAPDGRRWRFVAQWAGDAIHRGDGSKVLVWKP
jgi:photosystem II stability/assembly factor-like uncharacterized protein